MVHSSKHLNLTSSDGYTPLHYAAVNGHTQICSLLAAQVRPFQLEISIIVIQIVLTKTQTDILLVRPFLLGIRIMFFKKSDNNIDRDAD